MSNFTHEPTINPDGSLDWSTVMADDDSVRVMLTELWDLIDKTADGEPLSYGLEVWHASKPFPVWHSVRYWCGTTITGANSMCNRDMKTKDVYKHKANAEAALAARDGGE